MQLITAIERTLRVSGNISLFLAGGISNCPNWQNKIIEELKDIDNLTIFNPRRCEFIQKSSYDNDKNASIEVIESRKQIEWESIKLITSDILVFWFSRGSPNPISLYELGYYAHASDKEVFIGIDPEYERKIDVEIQTELARPDIKIVYSLDNLVEQIKEFINNKK
jgi:hypothetical protein